ncbi:MAG: DegV family protein, partial [Chloroflexi bacterium]|nr:DegV family protein [Chloroflexota bacterium]
ECYREVELDNARFYPMMAAKGIPASSMPAAGEMLAEMLRVVEAGCDLCCVFISSAMSSTYESAHAVREMVLERVPGAKIALVDSHSNCMQLGYAALAAARAAHDGGTLEQAVAAAEDNTRKSRFLFIPRTLEYLKKGGRIGMASALLADLLKIIPVLTVENGFTTTLKKVRTRRAAEEAMLAQMSADVAAHGLGEVAVHHIDCPDSAQQLAAEIKRRLGAVAEIIDIGPVIGMHVGPGTVGVVYCSQTPLR